METEFKVGDRVVVKSLAPGVLYGVTVGDVGTVRGLTDMKWNDGYVGTVDVVLDKDKDDLISQIWPWHFKSENLKLEKQTA